MFLDLAEILANSIADSKMSAITWIIIVLIVISILVTVTEVVLRFAMLQGNKAAPASALVLQGDAGKLAREEFVLVSPPSSSSPHDMALGEASFVDGDDAPLSDLETLARALGIQSNASVADMERAIWNLRRAD